MLKIYDTVTNLLTFNEEFLIIILVYSFLNLIFAIVFLELLWPTHFFNQRHSNLFKGLNFRSFNAVFLKVYKFNWNKLNNFFLKNFFPKKS